jgi:hypothetical protein
LSSASAMARPIPEEEPQTIAVLSLRLIRTPSGYAAYSSIVATIT